MADLGATSRPAHPAAGLDDVAVGGIAFATSSINGYDVDGVVWCVNLPLTHSLLPINLRSELIEQGAHAFTVPMLEKATPDLGSFDQSRRHGEFPVFLEPPSLDSRIVNQYALMSVMPGAVCDLGAWCERQPTLVRRVIIPRSIKWEIRDKLDQANVTERVLFPGLDGLAQWLRRHYSPTFRAPGRPVAVRDPRAAMGKGPLPWERPLAVSAGEATVPE